MTVMYLTIRYIGIPYSVLNVLQNMTLISLSDAVSTPQPPHSHQTNTLICRD
ncbi:hypothetical protein BDR03DRAFT_957201, partial [Suillus americanus]